MMLSQTCEAQKHPREAIPAIVEDIASHSDSEHFRYIWIHDGRKHAAAYVNTTINQVLSNSGNVVNAVSISNDVLRLDLRLLQSKHVALIWEKFRDDEPYFLANDTVTSIDVTVSMATVKVATNIYAGNAVIAVLQPGDFEALEIKPGWIRLSQGWIQDKGVLVRDKTTTKSNKRNRTFGPHLPPEASDIHNPIVRYDYFL